MRGIGSLSAIAFHLASAYSLGGRPGEAITIPESDIAELTRLLGPDHRLTLTARIGLGSAYAKAGIARAVVLLEQVSKDCERLLGRRDRTTIFAKTVLVKTYYQAGWYCKANRPARKLAANNA